MDSLHDAPTTRITADSTSPTQLDQDTAVKVAIQFVEQHYGANVQIMQVTTQMTVARMASHLFLAYVKSDDLDQYPYRDAYTSTADCHWYTLTLFQSSKEDLHLWEHHVTLGDARVIHSTVFIWH